MSRDFFKKHYPLIRIIELTLDFMFIVLSFVMVIHIEAFITTGNFIESFKDIYANLFSNYISVFSTQILYVIIIFLFFMVYQVSVSKKTYASTIKSAFLALLMSNITVILISFIFNKMVINIETIFYVFLAQLLTFSIYKYFFHRIIRKINKRHILIIGPKEEALKIATKFLMEREAHESLKYIFFEHDKKISEEIIKYINKVDDVIILQGLSEYNKNNIMTYCLSKNYTNVYLVPKLYEISIMNSKVDQIRDTPVFLSQSLHLSITQRFLKRSFDIIISLIGLFIASPILLVSAILIKSHDKGPIFFKQERITRNDKCFTLVKFRTMIVDAEKETGAIWALENDPRITKIGRFLRKTRIDELPQLYNVLKGEMSIIGPRPEREFFIKEFIKSIPDFKYRVQVKPGITGLAQVLGKYNSDPDDKLRFDLIYIRNYSIWLDLKIIFLTVKAVLDKDSSATNGLPLFEDMLTKSDLETVEIPLGLQLKKVETK